MTKEKPPETPEKSCFVISPIGEEGSDTRKRADQVLKHVINPAVEECGYTALRADKMSEPGMITSQVIQRIVDDPLVVADLTGMNPNVFYELAVRHAVRKPLVQLICKGEKIPFDVAGMRTIPVDHTDLDSVDEARDEIVRQIKATEGKSPEQIESPISVSMELQLLRQSENPEERSVAKIVSVVSELRSNIDSIEKKLSSPTNLIPPEYLEELMRRSGGFSRRHLHVMMREIELVLAEFRERMPEKGEKNFEQAFERLEKRLIMLLHDMGDERFIRYKG